MKSDQCKQTQFARDREKFPLPITKVSFSQIKLFFNSKGLVVQKSGVTTNNS